jgi:hypothetical protein
MYMNQNLMLSLYAKFFSKRIYIVQDPYMALFWANPLGK